jgi:hypothetical protein
LFEHCGASENSLSPRRLKNDAWFPHEGASFVQWDHGDEPVRRHAHHAVEPCQELRPAESAVTADVSSRRMRQRGTRARRESDHPFGLRCLVYISGAFRNIRLVD